MKTEVNKKPVIGKRSERSRREIVSKAVENKVSDRPIVTCECAFWGPPSPRFFWDEKGRTN